ncbi:MAG: hypothetical protein K2Y39_28110 [Candidatus Obscuribacterales bacterium]|nr:hypothetical protein [Candidatus Obscuribacterales bacterium]
MTMDINQLRRIKQRSQTGSSQLTEFGAAIFLLFSCIVIPLLDLSIVPVRLGLGKSIVSHRVHQLAQSECLSDAFKSLQESDFHNGLTKIGGFNAKTTQLLLVATSVRNPDVSLKVDRPGALPSDWLPGGNKGPCLYRLDLTVDAEIEPLITAKVPGVKIVGLTTPIPFHLREESNWENMGCDPMSGEFFVNK